MAAGEPVPPVVGGKNNDCRAAIFSDIGRNALLLRVSRCTGKKWLLNSEGGWTVRCLGSMTLK